MKYMTSWKQNLSFHTSCYIATRTIQWSWYAGERAKGREQEKKGKRVRAKRGGSGIESIQYHLREIDLAFSFENRHVTYRYLFSKPEVTECDDTQIQVEFEMIDEIALSKRIYETGN